MATSPLVPAVLPFAIDGHEYLIDAQYERTTVQVIRQQADTSSEPGEQTLSPLGLWRRSQESWHHGAGQDFLDGKQGDSPTDPHRFRSSKGVDVWTKGQISLLHPTLKVWSTTNTNLHMVLFQTTNSAFGGPLFLAAVADGTELFYNGLPYGGMNTAALKLGTGFTATNASISVSGTWFNLVSTAGGAFSVQSPTGTSGVPVDPGREYGFVVQSTYNSGGAARTPSIRVDWYTAAGASVGSPTTAAGSGVDTGGIAVYGQATAPATAAFAALTVSYPASAAGESHAVRFLNIGPYDDVETLGGPDTWDAAGIQAGQPAQTIQSLATNGSHVWAALGTSGLHRLDPSLTPVADVPAAPGAGQIHLVGFANGFLLAAGSTTSTTGRNTLWSVTDPLGAPALSVIKTHPNANFAWTGIGPGRSCLYAWGNSGGTGEVYKITYDQNTGTLSTAASFATYLPDGETIHALAFYAGGIIMGTGKGVRLGQADGAGNIDYGPLIETDWPVRCLEPQGRYCWFGWTKHVDLFSALGRIDLGYFTDTLTPAWASDLFTADSSTGDVVACITMFPYGYLEDQRPPVRMFTVAGEGVYIEDPSSRVAQATLDTGAIRFSTSEPKTARYLDIRHHALPEAMNVTAMYQVDASGTWVNALVNSTVPGSYGPPTSVPLDDEPFEAIEFKLVFGRTAAPTDYSVSPEITRWTAKVLPLPSTIDDTFTVKIHMKSTVETTAGDGQPYYIDVPTEITFLKDLERSRAIVEMQLGDEVHDVYVLSSKFVGEHWNSPKREFAEGMLELVCQTARG